nr:hypothetical protein CFP56_69648 [Quercus suber]
MNDVYAPVLSTEPTLYVVVPPSRLFAAHWSFFLPDLSSYDPVSKRYEEPNTGRRIHVTGDRLNGFRLEIIRNYDIRKHRSAKDRRLPIARVPLHILQKRDGVLTSIDDTDVCFKDDEEGGGYVSNEPIDAFEKVCVEVPAPGLSLNQVSTGMRVATNEWEKRVKPEVRDCQWWVRQVVDAMMAKGMLQPLPITNGDGSVGVRELVLSLPKH